MLIKYIGFYYLQHKYASFIWHSFFTLAAFKQAGLCDIFSLTLCSSFLWACRFGFPSIFLLPFRLPFRTNVLVRKKSIIYFSSLPESYIFYPAVLHFIIGADTGKLKNNLAQAPHFSTWKARGFFYGLPSSLKTEYPFIKHIPAALAKAKA